MIIIQFEVMVDMQYSREIDGLESKRTGWRGKKLFVAAAKIIAESEAAMMLYPTSQRHNFIAGLAYTHA